MRSHHHFIYGSMGFLALCVSTAGVFFVLFASPSAGASLATEQAEATEAVTGKPVMETPVIEVVEIEPSEVLASSGFAFPVANALARVTKKPFGLHIEKGRSPVENDRFSGFHVGVDFEAFEDEQDIDVPVYAICEGPLLFKKFANGYGGVAVQECEIDERKIAVIYGHVRLSSVTAETGDMLSRGEQIAVLGRGYSPETDGVRKHLHLGIQTGSPTDIRGYVQNEEEIDQWLDVLEYFSH